MRRETIAIIWIGGLILAAVLYAVGTDRFLEACLSALDTLDYALHNLVFTLGAQTYAVVRALTIALYAVFLVLALIASNRGLRGFGALVMITIANLILVWRPFDPYPVPVTRWFAALLLSLIGAIVMTQRLAAPPRRHDPPPPYPPGGRIP